MCPAVSAVQARPGGQRRPPPTEAQQEVQWAGDRKGRPYGALQGVRRGERNPLVTASPCQPPLGKGAMGTGVTDCHNQCAHWFRNDTLQEMLWLSDGGVRTPRPYGWVARSAVQDRRADRGVRPYGGQ